MLNVLYIIYILLFIWVVRGNLLKSRKKYILIHVSHFDPFIDEYYYRLRTTW